MYNIIGGLQRNGTLRSSTIKKVAPPTVPDLTNNNPPLAASVPQPSGTLVAISNSGVNVASGGGTLTAGQSCQTNQGNQVPLNRLSCYSTGSSGSSHSSGSSSVATYDSDSVVYQSTTIMHHLPHVQQSSYHSGQQQLQKHHVLHHSRPPMRPSSPGTSVIND